MQEDENEFVNCVIKTKQLNFVNNAQYNQQILSLWSLKQALRFIALSTARQAYFNCTNYFLPILVEFLKTKFLIMNFVATKTNTMKQSVLLSGLCIN